jgi:succinate dehydrogenase hydrophobic anchor subunit
VVYVRGNESGGVHEFMSSIPNRVVFIFFSCWLFLITLKLNEISVMTTMQQLKREFVEISIDV